MTAKKSTAKPAPKKAPPRVPSEQDGNAPYDEKTPASAKDHHTLSDRVSLLEIQMAEFHKRFGRR